MRCRPAAWIASLQSSSSWRHSGPTATARNQAGQAAAAAAGSGRGSRAGRRRQRRVASSRVRRMRGRRSPTRCSASSASSSSCARPPPCAATAPRQAGAGQGRSLGCGWETRPHVVMQDVMRLALLQPASGNTQLQQCTCSRHCSRFAPCCRGAPCPCHTSPPLPPTLLQHPAAAAGALSREGLSDLLLAALHLGLDPAANQLREEITEGEYASFDALFLSNVGPQYAAVLAAGWLLCGRTSSAAETMCTTSPALPLAPTLCSRRRAAERV